jgi:nicotinate-nucleotide adenylyltransferase
VETVRELLAESEPDEEVVWVIGADSLPELSLWRDVEDLVDRVEIVTAVRRGIDPRAALAELEGRLGRDRTRRLAAGILTTPVVEISSSEIRARLGSGRSIRYMVPEPVREYIRRNGLYQA